MTLPLRALAVAVAVGVTLSSTGAMANGRFPAANQLVTSPQNRDALVLRTTFGLLVSKNRGASWDWVCEQAIGVQGTEDPAMGITSSGRIVAGLATGLASSPDLGCAWSWAPSPLASQVVIDVTVHPKDPNVVYALASTFVGQDAGASRFDNFVAISRNGGATWEKLGAPLDSSVIGQTIEVAPQDNRLYVSGVRDVSTTSMGVLLVSKNDGASWTEHAIPLDPESERAPFISAVDPNVPDRLYVRTSGSTRSRLLVSENGGASFDTWLTASGLLLGFALSSDGETIFAGGPRDGLLVARRADRQFAKRSDLQVQCLTVTDGELWACSSMSTGPVLHVSRDQGATFVPNLRFEELKGPLACAPATSVTEKCPQEWPATRDRLAVPRDAGTVPDASSEAPVPPPPSLDDCDCRHVGATRAASGAWLFLVALALLRRRR